MCCWLAAGCQSASLPMRQQAIKPPTFDQLDGPPHPRKEGLPTFTQALKLDKISVNRMEINLFACHRRMFYTHMDSGPTL